MSSNRNSYLSRPASCLGDESLFFFVFFMVHFGFNSGFAEDIWISGTGAQPVCEGKSLGFNIT